MLQSDWLGYSLSIRQYISSSANEGEKDKFFAKKDKDTRMFLLKQLDYSHAFSMKR